MIAIIAVNNLGFIGKENKLPWRSMQDLQHFKAMTLNRRLLVGFNTFQALPGVVKQRVEFVDNRQTYFGLITRLVCIGGKKTYEKYCSAFTELHISRINDNSIGDCTFPDLHALNPNCKIYLYNFEVDGIKQIDNNDLINSIGSQI